MTAARRPSSGSAWRPAPAEPAPIYWVARGSYARRAGEQPRWLPGLRVALDQYQQLEPPVTLGEIRQHKDALLALREQIQARASGQPVFFPWIPYQDTIRTFQSYLVKMPQQAISLFPRLRAMVDRAEARTIGIRAGIARRASRTGGERRGGESRAAGPRAGIPA